MSSARLRSMELVTCQIEQVPSLDRLDAIGGQVPLGVVEIGADQAKPERAIWRRGEVQFGVVDAEVLPPVLFRDAEFIGFIRGHRGQSNG